jgi:hypothetical protein
MKADCINPLGMIYGLSCRSQQEGTHNNCNNLMQTKK